MLPLCGEIVSGNLGFQVHGLVGQLYLVIQIEVLVERIPTSSRYISRYGFDRDVRQALRGSRHG